MTTEGVQKARWLILDVLRSVPKASGTALYQLVNDNGMSFLDYYKAIQELDAEGKVVHDAPYFTRQR